MNVAEFPTPRISTPLIVRPKFQPTTFLWIALIGVSVVAVILYLKVKEKSATELLVLVGLGIAAFTIKPIIDAWLRKVNIHAVKQMCQRDWYKRNAEWMDLGLSEAWESPPQSNQWLIHFPDKGILYSYDHRRRSIIGNIAHSLFDQRALDEKSQLTRIALQQREFIEDALKQAAQREGYQT